MTNSSQNFRAARAGSAARAQVRSYSTKVSLLTACPSLWFLVRGSASGRGTLGTRTPATGRHSAWLCAQLPAQCVEQVLRDASREHQESRSGMGVPVLQPGAPDIRELGPTGTGYPLRVPQGYHCVSGPGPGVHTGAGHFPVASKLQRCPGPVSANEPS